MQLKGTNGQVVKYGDATQRNGRGSNFDEISEVFASPVGLGNATMSWNVGRKLNVERK